MNGPGSSYLISQLGYQAPSLLVYLIAFFFALSYMERAPKPSMLTLCGVGILLFTSIGVTFGQHWLLENGRGEGRYSADFTQLMTMIGFAGAFARAIGMGLLVTAIFVGRRPTFHDHG